MKDIEAYVKPKRKKKGLDKDGDDVYDMCDSMLKDLNYLDTELESREIIKDEKVMNHQNKSNN
jgi:hypothetical protein